MKFVRLWAALLALSCLPSYAIAQAVGPAAAPGGYAPSFSPCAVAADGKCYTIGAANGLPTSTAIAISTPCVIAAAPTVATPSGCTYTGSAGAYIVGPFVPQAGYPVRLVATGTWTGSITVGTSMDNCATVNALTVAGQTWGSYTGNANEAVDVPPTTGGVKYCLSLTVTSGTLNVALRQ